MTQITQINADFYFLTSEFVTRHI